MDRYLVAPGSRVRLEQWDPEDREAFPGGKEALEEELGRRNRQLEELQELLYAEHRRRILIVLQGMDTSGKDGVIRHVFEGVNPQGVRVANFKAPSAAELDRDYLWRAHLQVPARGEMVIFNRSHYEDVLIVRVHGLVPAEVWQRRFDQINAFERMLAEEGTTILKFFLHIDPEEQKKRLQARLGEPEKRWKFDPNDLKERARWPAYQEAYEAVLSLTSTAWAPWTIVPANSKRYRNVVIASRIVETLRGLAMRYPPAPDGLDTLVVE
jgi:PPK2 family polyphosphate:nucleotide phosphotransferase